MSKTIPLIEEHVLVDTQTVETGRVRVRKVVDERIEDVAIPLQREQAQIRRVAVHRPVDQPVPTRQEGNVTIVSLHEEVTVVTRQLMVTEEWHISTETTQVDASQQVSLRREQIEVDRTGAPGATHERAEHERAGGDPVRPQEPRD